MSRDIRGNANREVIRVSFLNLEHASGETAGMLYAVLLFNIALLVSMGVWALSIGAVWQGVAFLGMAAWFLVKAYRKSKGKQ